MNITHPTHISPLKRNGVTDYLRRYLDTVSDWQTYAGVDITRPDAMGNAVRRVTTDYFSPRKLKGVALLLGAHLAQQVISTLTTTLIRTAIHGAALDTVRGIVIRRSSYHTHWNRLRPAWLAAIAEMTDSYYFHEGGRTWHVFTLKIYLWGETRTLSTLMLLTFPNRAFYFDRPLSYPQTVPLALGLTAPDTLPGFLGDTNELDAFIPPLRTLKQGLTLLNWLLIDPTERDSDLPSPTPYSDLTPPTGGTRPLPTHTPPRHPGGYYGGYTAAPNPYPAVYGYPNGNGVPAQPYPAYTNGNGAAPTPYPSPYPYPAPPTTLLEQPVSVLIRLDGREQWHTITRNAFMVRTASGRDTGLALTPAVETLSDGRVVEDDHRWNVTHLGSGRQLNQTPLPHRDRAQALAAALLVIDWTRAVDDIPPADLSRAQAIIGGSYVQ